MESYSSKVKFPATCIHKPEESVIIEYSKLDLEIKTLADYISDLNKNLNLSVESSDISTYHLENLESREKTQLSFFQDLLPFYINQSSLKRKIVLLLKDFTGKNYSFIQNTHEKIHRLKLKIQNRIGPPVDLQRLLCCAKQLDDDRTLADYNIPDQAAIFLIPRLRGGGKPLFDFVDLESNKIKKLKFSNSAPKWHTVKPGLNIFGICLNQICKAYKKKVICPIDMEVFEPINDCDIVKCPICKENFLQETCGFYQCSYTWTGIKVEENNKIKKLMSQNWNHVGNEFFYFDPEENGKAKWRSLKILTRIKATEPKCGVCCEELDSSCKKLDCSHSYHTTCLDKLQYVFKKNCVLCL